MSYAHTAKTMNVKFVCPYSQDYECEICQLDANKIDKV